tara:strand:- start:486 stop:908 length:423 start_codon:yes stop_codon:yes gene_type:complete
MFKGKSDWNFIKNVKKKVKIPVVVNGDINDFKDFQESLEKSNGDGVMIGRGSYGKPWIFNEIKAKINSDEFKIKNDLKKDIILEHFNLSLEHYGIDIGLKSFRKHLGWYSKSLENSNEFRFKINKCLIPSEVERYIKDFF